MVKSLRFTFPAIFIFIVMGLRQCTDGVYVGMGREIPDQLPLLMSISLFWAIGWWLNNDLRQRGETLVYCLGMVLWIAWPVLLPYYLIKTRGRRAFITLAAFAGVSVVGSVCGAILGVFLS